MTSTNTSSPAVEQRSSEPQRLQIKPELWLILIELTVLYAIAVWINMRRFVWFDELFTLGIARASSLSQLLYMSLKFDSNPTPVYLLSRLSMTIFGVTPLGLRLPSIIEFYLGSMALLLYVRRKAGFAFALVFVLILWASGAFSYAVEARPYALLFMSCAILALSWDIATRASKRSLALGGAAASSFGLFSAHAFGPFSLLPLVVAEAVRFWRRRQPDYALWAVLLLPSVAMIVYIPLFQTYKLLLFSKAFEASFPRLGTYFYDSVDSLSLSLLLALIAPLAVARLGESRREDSCSRPEDFALFAGSLMSPILLTLDDYPGPTKTPRYTWSPFLADADPRSLWPVRRPTPPDLKVSSC